MKLLINRIKKYCKIRKWNYYKTTFQHSAVKPFYSGIDEISATIEIQKILLSVRQLRILKVTPLTTQISASKFQNLSQIPLKIRGVWKNRGV